MRHALEDLHIDAVVVASAATLALQYLRRRYGFPSSRCVGGGGGGGKRAASKSSVTLPPTRVSPRGGRQPRGRRLNENGGRVAVVLLSVTCLHLASKYHCVHEEKVASLGTRLNPQKIFKLGESPFGGIALLLR